MAKTITTTLEYAETLGRYRYPIKHFDYDKFVEHNYKPVKIVPCKSLPIAKEISEYAKDGISLGSCYLHAYHLTMDIEGVEYVEGVTAIKGIDFPLEHGWCCYKGQHFDISEYSDSEHHKGFQDYIKIFQFSHLQLCILASRYKHSGNYDWELLCDVYGEKGNETLAKHFSNQLI